MDRFKFSFHFLSPTFLSKHSKYLIRTGGKLRSVPLINNNKPNPILRNGSTTLSIVPFVLLLKRKKSKATVQNLTPSSNLVISGRRAITAGKILFFSSEREARGRVSNNRPPCTTPPLPLVVPRCLAAHRSRNHGKLLNYPRMDYTAFWIKLETLRGRLLIMVIKHGAPLSRIFG